MKSDTLALFDFDGTITTRDTMFEVIRFRKGKIRFWLGMLWLLPVFILMKAGFISNWRAKEILISFFFKGVSLKQFDEDCARFAREWIPRIVRKSAIRRIQQHCEAGDKLLIISASAENWVRPWAEQWGIEVLASRLQVDEQGRVTGRLSGLNCNGKEKVNRLHACLDIAEYKKILVYGDSRGDNEMLALATEPYYRFFKD